MFKKKFFPYFVFCYFGIFNMVLGTVLIEISSKLNVLKEDLSFYLTIAIFIQAFTVFLNGFILDNAKLKKEAYFGVFLVIIGVMGFVSTSNIFVFIFFYSITSIGQGILFSLSNYFLLVFYETKERPRKNSMMHFFFTIGAIVGPYTAGLFLEINIPWEYVYIISISIILLAIITIFKKEIDNKIEDHTIKEDGQKWPKDIFLSSFAILAYVLSEMTLVLWFVTYLREYIGATESIAGFGLSVFWVFMGVGRYLSSVILKYITTKKYILIFSLGAVISLIITLSSASIILIIIFISITGIMYSGLFPVIVSYGTEIVPFDTSKILSVILTFGSLGHILANPISSFVVKIFKVDFVLYISVIFMSLVFVFMLMGKDHKKKLKE